MNMMMYTPVPPQNLAAATLPPVAVERKKERNKETDQRTRITLYSGRAARASALARWWSPCAMPTWGSRLPLARALQYFFLSFFLNPHHAPHHHQQIKCVLKPPSTEAVCANPVRGGRRPRRIRLHRSDRDTRGPTEYLLQTEF